MYKYLKSHIGRSRNDNINVLAKLGSGDFNFIKFAWVLWLGYRPVDPFLFYTCVV